MNFSRNYLVQWHTSHGSETGDQSMMSDVEVETGAHKRER